MTNLMQTGAAWLGKKLKSSAGRTVTIRQGTKTLSDITAVSLVQQEHEVMGENGFATKVESFDWTFVASDLDTLELRPGDLIHEVVGGIASKYELVPLGDNKDAVEPADASGVLIIAHTKKVA